MKKLPEEVAVEFAASIVPHRPWIDKITHQQEETVRQALQKAWLDGYTYGRRFEWVLKKEQNARRKR